jgi:hypothetical protein
VRESLTTVAKPPTASLQEKAAETTKEESLIAILAHSPKSPSDILMRCPRAGNRNTAMILKRKIVEMANVTSSSFASITGAVAAFAEPPQMEVPTQMRMIACLGTFLPENRMLSSRNAGHLKKESNIPARIARTGFPMMGTRLPRLHAEIAGARVSKKPDERARCLSCIHACGSLMTFRHFTILVTV